LGRAGDVKKVADGFGRNYLLPQGLAVLATPGALKQAESIRVQADEKRAIANEEMGSVAEMLSKLELVFPVKAGETGKLYGSVTQVMIASAISEQTGIEINRRQMDFQPIRNLGVHKAEIRLTIDLIPEVTVIVHREGESPEETLAELEAAARTEERLKAASEAAELAETEAGEAAETGAGVIEEETTEGEPSPSAEEEAQAESLTETETAE